jgi:hypothetical protein
MLLGREDVLERFCDLSMVVMEEVFQCTIPADCFCGQRHPSYTQFDDEILEFIEEAVEEAIERKGAKS